MLAQSVAPRGEMLIADRADIIGDERDGLLENIDEDPNVPRNTDLFRSLFRKLDLCGERVQLGR